MILGEALDRPVSALVAWTAVGLAYGGTGMAIRIAKAHGFPVLHLGPMSPREVCQQLDAIRRDASVS